MSLDAVNARVAVSQLYERVGLAPDGGASQKLWAMDFGPLRLWIPNFRWRKAAIPVHDLHHVLTGYECNILGEIEISTWEFAAGRCPSIFAALSCLPLTGAGAIIWPRKTYAAFLRGRDSTTLYDLARRENIFARTVPELQSIVLPSAPRPPRAADRLAYTWLVTKSLAWIATATAIPIITAAYAVSALL